MTTALPHSLIGSEGRSARDLLPEPLLSQLRQTFSRRQVEYIAHVLSVGELNLLADLHDALIIARIKRLSPQRLQHYDQFVPLDRQGQKAYELTQLRWIKDEEYLLGTRLGRSPTPRELFTDFLNSQNGLRFRAYYVLKYPGKMKRKSARPAPAGR